jgi:ATP-dependent DNA helicase RecQ
MNPTNLAQSTSTSSPLPDVVQRYWGYDRFLPLQEEAMQCVLDDRDSVVVLPTGGGKSLCFQAPALCKEGLAVVVSPLISLMKDQVDALQSCGVPAACVNSMLSYQERSRVADDVRNGTLKLLYLAPERLLTERTLDFLKTAHVSFIAIDEAHCISEWGHDFRPEYHELSILKDVFPGVAVHTYTATATEQVRSDIAKQLGLNDPQTLVGSFDRPNLVYKVQRRDNRMGQICEVLDRHKGESGIIYCIRRADVDDVSAILSTQGYRALPYHAGMSNDDRKRNQDAFIQEQTDTIVATVAFGMGIDKSNVRYVIHAGMPKSLENYQQESGRAGRDGLEAECCLFYSGGDFMQWKRMLSDLEPAAYEASMQTLTALNDFCTGMVCRHQSLVSYFGQNLESNSCNACDVCLDNLDLVDDALVVSQKILSCIVRLGERFGEDYTSKVLIGSKEKRILEKHHDRLSTYGILSDEDRRDIRDWIDQLIGQRFLVKSGEYSVLELTPTGREVLRGETAPRLLKPKRSSEKKHEPGLSAMRSFEYFAEGKSVEDVAKQMGRALSTTRGYLAEYLRSKPICDPSPWVAAALVQRIESAAETTGLERLKPTFDHLDGTVGYDEIRIVIQCLRNKTKENQLIET